MKKLKSQNNDSVMVMLAVFATTPILEIKVLEIISTSQPFGKKFACPSKQYTNI